MKNLFISIILFLFSIHINCFDGLLFKPLTANHLEARIGAFYQPSTEKNAIGYWAFA